MSKHDHSNCYALLTSISEYVDGTLNEALCEELEQHLTECENCTVVVDTLRKTIMLYQKTTDEATRMPHLVRERLYRVLNLDDFHS